MASIAGVHKEKTIFSLTTGLGIQVPPGTSIMLDSGGVNPIQVSVICDGSPVEIGLSDDQNNPGGLVNSDGRSNTNALNSSVIFYRDGVAISTQPWSMVDISGSARQMAPPLNSFRFIDTPTAGTHVYTTAVQNNNSSTNNNEYSYVRLYAVKR
jgi:hypothetical protein